MGKIKFVVIIIAVFFVSSCKYNWRQFKVQNCGCYEYSTVDTTYALSSTTSAEYYYYGIDSFYTSFDISIKTIVFNNSNDTLFFNARKVELTSPSIAKISEGYMRFDSIVTIYPKQETTISVGMHVEFNPLYLIRMMQQDKFRYNFYIDGKKGRSKSEDIIFVADKEE